MALYKFKHNAIRQEHKIMLWVVCIQHSVCQETVIQNKTTVRTTVYFITAIRTISDRVAEL